MDASSRPLFVASGADPLGGAWQMSVVDGPSGPMLWTTSPLGEGGAGPVGPIAQDTMFGAVGVGPFGKPTPRAVQVDGIVTDHAWRVAVELRGGAQVDAHLARVPTEIAPGTSAFITFIPGDQTPVAVVAIAQDGRNLGVQTL